MIKIGIVTLYNKNYNYGGQLQAYAMQKVFTTSKTYAEIISFSTKRSSSIKQRIKKIGLKKGISILIRKLLYKLLSIRGDYKAEFKIRKERFDDFIAHIPHSQNYGEDSIVSCNRIYDQFVCGSDQVWNPTWWNDILFLSFASKRKYAYAASIAVEHLTPSEKEHIKDYTKDFYAISVREVQTQKMLSDFLDRKIYFTLDPTLLVDKKEWEAIALESNEEQKYVLLYMLGNEKGVKKDIYKICKKEGYRVVSIGFCGNKYFYADKMYSDRVVKDAGPREWLGWIKNADYVFTDSFHGSVFSIIFQKEFWCFERENPSYKFNENSRLYSFLNTTGLTSRLLKCGTELSIRRCKAIDYIEINNRIEEYRKQSIDYIYNCINNSI